jgi:hypothetical protein
VCGQDPACRVAEPCDVIRPCHEGDCACLPLIQGRGTECVHFGSDVCADYPPCDRNGGGLDCPIGTCCMDTCCPTGICATPCPLITCATPSTPRVRPSGAVGPRVTRGRGR